MRFLLSKLLYFLISLSILSAQSERPESIVIPVSSLGDVSETRKKILQNTLEDELKEHFMLISQERFEEAQEKAFEELDYEECTEDQCIMIIQEMLQVENVFHLEVIGEGNDTQLSLSWRTLDEKKTEEEFCEGCGTGELRLMIEDLIEKLVDLKIAKRSESSKIDKKIFKESSFNSRSKKRYSELFVTVGEYGTILTSNDGISWIKRGSGAGHSFTGIVFGNNSYTIVGRGNSITSSDGIRWAENSQILEQGGLNDIIYSNGKFITVGGFNGNGVGEIFSSLDGNSWEKNSNNIKNILHGIVYGKGIYVVVGQSGTILTSNNLNQWESRVTGYDQTFHNITFGNGLFVTVGGSIFSDSNGQIYVSTDGFYWKSQHYSMKPFKDVVFGNGQFIAVGGSIFSGSDGIIFKSKDGLKWEKVAVATKPLNSITFGNGMFITVGQSGNIMTSTDGQIWTSQLSGTSRPLLDITSSY